MPPSASPPPSKPTPAEAPFDDARADLILETCDGVHFRIFHNILSLASPIFNNMFSIPLPPSQKPDEVQVVRLSEDSDALDVALRHIYPVRPPKVADTLHCAGILAEFARKYQVETLDNFIIRYLTDSIESDPVGVYAIAVTYEYNDIGADAARACLYSPFSELESPYLRCITAEHLSELHRYHVACGEAASAVASSDLKWLSLLDTAPEAFVSQLRGSSGSGCQACSMQELRTQTSNTSSKRYGPRSLWNYLYCSALLLSHHPTAEEITTKDFVLKTNKCNSCSHTIRKDLLEVSDLLWREVKNAVKRVSLSLIIAYPLSHVCDIQWRTLIVLIPRRYPYPRLFLWSQILPPPPLPIDRESVQVLEWPFVVAVRGVSTL